MARKFPVRRRIVRITAIKVASAGIAAVPDVGFWVNLDNLDGTLTACS
jgi:hypothetical protein